MRPINHVVVSVGGGVLMALALKSWMSGAAFFISGVFIDIDHHLDYFLHYKKFPFRLHDLVDFCNDHKLGKIYLIFHSYELFLIVWLWIHFSPVHVFWYSFMLGATVHIVFDQMVNPMRPYGYFFLYRLKWGFQKKHIYSVLAHEKQT